MSIDKNTQNLKIDTKGLWSNNPALVQLLGLCPLLAVSNTVANGLAMGIATTLILLMSAFFISLLQNFIPKSVRLPAFMLIIASAVTIIELLIKAYFYNLYISLGIFIPLIVTNCIIIGRAEAFASKNKLIQSLLDALIMGAGFTWVICVLGAVRELLSKGTLFSGFENIFGNAFSSVKIQILDFNPLLLAGLPAGAFIILGLIIAIKQAVNNKNNK